MTEPHAALEAPSCPLCDHPLAKPAYSWPGQPYRVVRCKRCAFHYLSPRPSETAMLQTYSQDSYFDREGDEGYSSYAAQEPALRQTFARLLRELKQRGVGGTSLLEVGCGYGYLLDEARPYFDLRYGSDFSAYAAKLARPFAQEIFVGGLETVPDQARYDCIISNHVIEHVYRPEAFVQSLVAKLAPGGSVLISTPHFGSFWRKLMGRRWPSFKLPEHVLYFDEPHLSELMGRCGLSKIQRIPYPHAFPIELIGEKLGLNLPKGIGSLWLPQTTLALCGQR